LGGLIKRSFSLAGHRTSVALEAEFWDALHAAALTRRLSLSALVASVDSGRDGTTPLASSLRVLALRDAFDGSLPVAREDGTQEKSVNEPAAGDNPGGEGSQNLTGR